MAVCKYTLCIFLIHHQCVPIPKSVAKSLCYLSDMLHTNTLTRARVCEQYKFLLSICFGIHYFTYTRILTSFPCLLLLFLFQLFIIVSLYYFYVTTQKVFLYILQKVLFLLLRYFSHLLSSCAFLIMSFNFPYIF